MVITNRKVLLIIVGLVMTAVAVIAVVFVNGKDSPIKPTSSVRLTDLIADPGARLVADYNLGDAFLKSGEKDMARKAFTTCLELAPASGDASRVREEVRQLSSA
jgi:hypothetical protein